MFLDKISLPVLREYKYSDSITLRETTGGEFIDLHRHLKDNSSSKFDDMSVFQYKSVIVLVSVWENGVSWLETIAKDWYKKEKKDGFPKHKSLGELIRSLDSNDFMSISYYFADYAPKTLIDDLYEICDEKLFPTSEATRELLKND